MSDIAVIYLDPRETECAVCGIKFVTIPTGPSFGVPMYEGLVLPNDWQGEWAGFDACRRCHDLQGTITHPMDPQALDFLGRDREALAAEDPNEGCSLWTGELFPTQVEKEMGRGSTDTT